ncbi:hypothetical protein LCGC14_1799400 [marine sediment metagenome]|uniref:IstB-like ATP-binding domain-containing protein n=1 Tax=marine sediment metagenome TaxID=412755 RepID=A0A0F9J4V4_9ZZZZ
MTTERSERYDLLAKISGMPLATGSTCTLMQFLPGKGTQKAYDAALQYVAVEGEHPREHHFITFVGEAGRGKTHLALSIGWQWLGQGMGAVKFWQVSELLDAMRKEYDKMPQDNYGNPLPGEFDKAKGCDLLILDDLGIEKSTEWAVDKLDTLIDHRWIEGKPTVFTTKLAPGQLGPHIRSRIREGVTVTLEGPDYRELKAKMRREVKP